MKKANGSALYAARSGWRRARDRFEYGALRSWDRDMFQLLCARVPEGGSVLSVGCGRALLDYWLVRVWGTEVHLSDLSQSCLDEVSRSFADVPHKTYWPDALDLPFEDDRFDLVWNAGVCASANGYCSAGTASSVTTRWLRRTEILSRLLRSL